MAQIFVGLMAEGSTDYRFLIPIIEKVLTEFAYECKGQIDIMAKEIECEKGNNFTELVCNASEDGHQNYGISMLIIHTDADDVDAKIAYRNKIKPAIASLMDMPDETHCKHVVALVPVQETEAWMLADKELLIKQIGAAKSEATLGINGHPEGFNNPKEKIENAIRIGRSDLPKKYRNSLQISDLYSIIGQSLQLEKLRSFDSFLDFENNLRKVFITLNYISPK